MRVPRSFPGEQNALNDGILTNSTHRACVHVAPNRDLYSPPGLFARHFTGVGANKERLFFERWPSRAVEALVALPSWNATACGLEVRRVRMRGGVVVRVEYTRHCLDASTQFGQALASAATRAQLWPRRLGGGGGGGAARTGPSASE